MSTLEGRYRRLLSVYPADHRAAYEREMLGVLMDGSRPGQRYPRPVDVFDLVRAGLSARLGRLVTTERGTGWRDAAAVTGLLVSVFLAAVAARRVAMGVFVVAAGTDEMAAYGVTGLIMVDAAVRAVAWLAVVAAVLAGLRRTAFALSGVAALVEILALLTWPPLGDGHLLDWRLLPVLSAVALLGAAVRARPVPHQQAGSGAVASRTRTVPWVWHLVAATVVGVVIGLPHSEVTFWLTGSLWAGEDLFWQVPGLGLLIAGGLLLAGLRKVEPPLRRRILVLLSPPAFLLLAEGTPVMRSDPRPGQMLLTVVATGVAVGGAVALLRRRERGLRKAGAAR